MKDLLQFKKFVQEINQENGRLYKQAVLEKYREDYTIRQFLKYAFDPFIQFGLGEKKLTKALDACEDAKHFGTLGLLEYLRQHNTGTDNDAALAQTVIRDISEVDITAANILTAVICKDLSLGASVSTINKAMPGLIREWAVQLAQKYFEKPEKLEGKEFVITEKLDGIRIIAIKDGAGNVSFFSRVGQPITGLVELEEEMKRLPSNIALDGEITIANYRDMPSGDAYKQTTKIVRLKDAEKRNLVMRVFDGMTAGEFSSQHTSMPYHERRKLIKDLFPAGEFKYFEVLPELYRGTDTSMVTKWLDKVVSEGGEGVMINLNDSAYKFTRCWDLMKVKKFQSLDLEVIDLEEGSGRLAGTLGAILVRYKGGNVVRVGSGFSDEERALYWSQPNLILNKVCEIKMFEETQAANGQYSLRFPTWVSNIRDPMDKATPDY